MAILEQHTKRTTLQKTKQEYRQFLNDNFKKLRLRKPMFYSWNVGLRFDLQVGETNTDEYFKEVTKRATTIFETAFDKSDKVFLIFMDFKYRRKKIRFSNFMFQQIENLKKTEVSYSKEKRLYESEDKFDVRNIAIIKTTRQEMNYANILNAIGHTDFGSRQPRLDQKSFFTAKEVYFVNIDKKLIFHMYDDRGLDIIATDKETIRQIYIKHNDWILDYDREKIDKQFEK